jgi:predicted acylesterase/phospholipase RssA
MDWADLLSPSLSHTTQYLPKNRQSHRYIFRWSHDRFVPSVPSELISLQKVEFKLMRLLSGILYDAHYSFDSLRIPLRVIAVDLVSGCRVIMKDGRLDQSIRGSIAIPGVFAPQTATGQILVDGGVLQYFPVDPLYELNPDIIIASLTIKEDTTRGTSLMDVVARTTSIAGYEDIKKQKLMADIVIEPDLSEFSSQDYSRAPEIIRAGEKAATAMIGDIRKKIAGRTPVAHHKTITPRPDPYVHAVEFKGLRRTRQQTVIEEIRTLPGMPLDFDRLIDDLERLFNTGLFDHVDYRLVPSGIDSTDVIFELNEKAYGFYLMGIRYDNRDNATLGLEVGQSNVFGRGLCVRAAATLGDPNEYRLGVSDTYTFGMPLGYQVDVFWNSIDRSFYENGTWQSDYNTDCRGGIAEVGYTLSEKTFANIGIHAYQVLYRIPETPFFDTIPTREWITGPSCNLEYNSYDDFYFPLRGGDYRVEVLYALEKMGAKNDFLRMQFSGDQLIPITSRILLNVGGDLGISTGELAWVKYFYTGGSNFAGFMSEDFTTAQKIVLRLGIDIKLLTLFSSSNPLLLQLISNIASFETLKGLINRDDYSLENFELGFGTGIRTNTAIGPLRITFGVGNRHRTPRNEHIQYSLHFSLGRDFRYTK